MYILINLCTHNSCQKISVNVMWQTKKKGSLVNMLLPHVDVVAMTRDPSLIKIICYCPALHHVLFLDFVCLMVLLFIYV